MKRYYTIAAVQPRLRFGQPEHNLSHMSDLVGRRRADLLVLPELATSGYIFSTVEEALSFAETVPGPSTDWAQRLAKRIRGCVVLGLPEKTRRKLYNSAVLVDATGVLAVYRKRNLFGPEHELFSKGRNRPPVVDASGLRVGLMICFDWTVPSVARLLAMDGADVIAHPANLVMPYAPTAMPVRALENGVYTVTANRVGAERRADLSLRFIGLSLIAGPRGERLAHADQTAETVITARCDVAAARDKTLPSGDVLLS
jgi:predicted amidohydrolase